jgi:carbon storage regulator
MLILSRKLNESIVIDGRIVVKVIRVEGEHVKLGIEAPVQVPVHRQEVYEEIQRNNREALTQGRPRLPRLPATPSCPKTRTTTPTQPAGMALLSPATQD